MCARVVCMCAYVKNVRWHSGVYEYWLNVLFLFLHAINNQHTCVIYFVPLYMVDVSGPIQANVFFFSFKINRNKSAYQHIWWTNLFFLIMIIGIKNFWFVKMCPILRRENDFWADLKWSNESNFSQFKWILTRPDLLQLFHACILSVWFRWKNIVAFNSLWRWIVVRMRDTGCNFFLSFLLFSFFLSLLLDECERLSVLLSVCVSVVNRTRIHVSACRFYVRMHADIGVLTNTGELHLCMYMTWNRGCFGGTVILNGCTHTFPSKQNTISDSDETILNFELVWMYECVCMFIRSTNFSCVKCREILFDEKTFDALVFGAVMLMLHVLV